MSNVSNSKLSNFGFSLQEAFQNTKEFSEHLNVYISRQRNNSMVYNVLLLSNITELMHRRK